MRILNLIITTGLLLSATGVANAAYVYGEFNDTYKSCTLTGWTGDAPTGSITIPSSYSKDGIKYAVTAIGANALNDMPEVTQINLPASIVKIGEVDKTYWAPVYNFDNCPKLKKFAVKSDNPVFRSSEDGLLISADGQHIYRIPCAFECGTSGRLDVPESYEFLGYDAMRGVTTIKSLKMKDSMAFSESAEFYAMPNLEKIFIYQDPQQPNPGIYHSKNGVLYDKESLVACPPKNTNGEFTVPAGVTTIQRYAFANCGGITSIKFADTSLTKIGKSAFAGSGLKEFTVPATVTSMSSFMFYGCKSLAKVTFDNEVSSLQAHIFDGCTALTSVKYNNGEPTWYNTGAFKNCKSLTNYFLDGNMRLDGDSIFAGSGLTKVFFKPGALNEWTADAHSYGRYMFTGCRDLELVNVTGVTADGDTGAFPLCPGMFTDCPGISKIMFPDIIKVVGSAGDKWGMYFSVNPIASQILVGRTGTGYTPPLFCYNDGAVHRPTIYWNADKWASVPNDCNLVALFATTDDTSVEPTIYSAVLTPKDYYDFAKAEYFVPAGAKDNYPYATHKGNKVEEMFTIIPTTVDGKVAFSIKSNYPGRVIMKSYTCGSRYLPNPNDAVFNTGVTAESETPIVVSYYVDTIELTTTYKASDIVAASTDLTTADDLVAEPIYYDISGRRVMKPKAGQLYIVSRGTNIAKEIY